MGWEKEGGGEGEVEGAVGGVKAGLWVGWGSDTLWFFRMRSWGIEVPVWSN